MKQLIVNADDFGLTRLVSQGILDAHDRGIVISTSLMAGGAAFDEAIAMAARAPQLNVGVHLTLIQGSPVSPPKEIPTLVDPRGRLWATYPGLLRNISNYRRGLREVEGEFRRQIVQVLRAGVTPTHLDGHKHVHILPGISEIVVRLAREFGIPCVRCPVEKVSLAQLRQIVRNPRPGVLKQFVAARAVSSVARDFRWKLRTAGLKHPASFYGLSQTGFLNETTLEQILRSLPDGVSELMCHPGYPDSLLATTGTRLLAQREIECRALMSPRIRKLAISEGVQLIGYSRLAVTAQGRESSNSVVKTATGCSRPI